ncbi:uncharacterized protein LOC121991479 [Zingiber officinale]|uniref:uncharacterized protein LOC121991479 n=1 Tax=Zingiber officinale TaxID=94328 RepID=UPI001C4B7E23|nr:uncharacterized protein LOC121991479 [Zingiber officinale]
MYNDELSKAITKAPKNSKYTSHDIQKQILHVLSVRVKNTIREEIRVAKYCIIVDEVRDESKREQMSIVLRFVDINGFIQEHFFGLVHVSDTAVLTLKDAIYSALAHYNLNVQNIRGQGYDDASNMRGKFNGLLTFIVNIVGSSCKRNDELKNAHADDIAYLIAINELEIGRDLNQIDSQLQEINGRFSDDAMELLILSNALNPQNAVESFRVVDICKLVEKFYAQDFTRDEKEQLEMQLKHYEYNIVKRSDYKNLSTILELCQWLVKTNKSVTYNLIFRVIILVLTLPISTATSERSFSAMNIMKTRLRSKMEDTFLLDALMVYIEREIARSVSIEAIIKDFKNLKECRIPFS